MAAVKVRAPLVWVCFGLFAVPISPGAALLTFDNFSLGTDSMVIPNGYGGLSWSNFYVLNGSKCPAIQGYHSGTVSPPNVAFTASGAPACLSSSSLFDLKSFYLTAAFLNGLQIRVRGFAGTNLLYDKTFVVGTNAPSFIGCNYQHVDTVLFSATPESQFVLDNLSTSGTSTNLNAHFVVNPNSGPVPLTVQFTDQSVGSITNWDWNFGDGSAHDSAQNPSHTYYTNGTFSVYLTVSDTDGGTNIWTAPISVARSPLPWYIGRPGQYR